MRTCSCFRVTTLLLALALAADGGVHEILKKAACLHQPLNLTAVCGSDQLVLRSLTLARAGNIPYVANCTEEIQSNFSTRNATEHLRFADLCCRLKPLDCTVPIELPSQNRSVLQEFAGFVDKCRAGGVSQCDLTNVISQGIVPPLHLSGSGKDCGSLSYVSVGYSCIKDQDVVPLSGADLNKTFPEGHVTLVSQENVTAARCLLYSPACDVTVGVGVLDADPRASCSLELSQGSRTQLSQGSRTQVFSCSSPPLYRSWNSPLFNSSHVTISVNVSSPSPRALWLTAEVLPRGTPLTVLCGQPAISVSPPACHTTASTSTSPTSTTMSTLSSLPPSTSAALKPAVPVAVGWAAFNATEKAICEAFPLTLTDSCDDSSSLALRAITLGRSADSSCASASRNDLLEFTARAKCCKHRLEDTSITYHLPSNRDNLPSPYKELAEKCFQNPHSCDLNGLPGVTSGQIPPGHISDQVQLTYVAVSFSCIPKAATLNFTESGTVTAPVVSLRMDGNSPVSSQCVVYSNSCDVIIKLGIIDVNVRDPCTLTLDNGSPVTKNCSSLQIQRQPLLQNSNAVAVSFHFNGTGVARQTLWLEAEGWDKSPITAVCGASAPALSSVRCAPASTSPTVPSKTAVPTDVPTKTLAPTKAPANTAASTKAPGNTAAPAKAPGNTAASTKAPGNTAASTKAPGNTDASTKASGNTDASTKASGNTDASTKAPGNTLAPTKAPTSVNSGITTVSAGQTTHAESSGLALPTYAVGLAAGSGGLVLVAGVLLTLFLCKRKPRGVVSMESEERLQRTSLQRTSLQRTSLQRSSLQRTSLQQSPRQEDTADQGYSSLVFAADPGMTAQVPPPLGPAWNPALRHDVDWAAQRHNQLPPLSLPDHRSHNPPGPGRAAPRDDYAQVNKPRKPQGNFEIAPDYDVDGDAGQDSGAARHPEDSAPVGRDNFVLRPTPLGDSGVRSNPLYSGEDADDVSPGRHLAAPDPVFLPAAPRPQQTGVVIPRPRLGYEEVTLVEGRPAAHKAGDAPPWGQASHHHPESQASHHQPHPQARPARSPPPFGQRVMPREDGPRRKLVSPQGGRRPTHALDDAPLDVHDPPVSDHSSRGHGPWGESPRQPDPWQGSKVRAPFGSNLSLQKNSWVLEGVGPMDNALYMEGKGGYSRGTTQPGGWAQ